MDAPALRDIVSILTVVGSVVWALIGGVVAVDKGWPALRRFWQGGASVITEHVIDPRADARVEFALQPFRAEVAQRFEAGSQVMAVHGDKLDQIIARQDVANGGLARLTDDIIDLKEVQHHQIRYMHCLPEYREPEANNDGGSG